MSSLTADRYSADTEHSSRDLSRITGHQIPRDRIEVVNLMQGIDARIDGDPSGDPHSDTEWMCGAFFVRHNQTWRCELPTDHVGDHDVEGLTDER